jgi:adenosylcobinamide-GDP ribazoletransferase
MTDALRLCVGTLTRFPITPPSRIDRRTAAGAMAIGPLIAGLMALVVGLVAQALSAWTDGRLSDALVAALAIGALAFITRGLHLDGLADTADALGSGKPAPQALEIARRSDIGPFGVLALVFIVLFQVLAYAGVISGGHAALGLTIAIGTSRLVLVVACLRGVPPARADGLGAAVAGSVSVPVALASIVGWTGLVTVACVWLAPSLVLPVIASVGGALAVGAVVVLVAVRRLGGITGDVLGAAIEIACASSLVILVVIPT